LLNFHLMLVATDEPLELIFVREDESRAAGGGGGGHLLAGGETLNPNTVFVGRSRPSYRLM
jgi:hypothetical protein